jgi:PTH1 family peptidyl-tRNA hydrolase
MKLVVGLGNPGRRYQGTRHNVGFAVIRELAPKYAGGKSRERFNGELWEASIGGQGVLLLCPLTFMNNSGSSVAAALEFYKLPNTELLVVCDDFQLPLGRVRVRPQGSAGGQKGLEDIIRVLGSSDFARLRIGIGPLPSRWDPADFVLSRFANEELPIVEQAVGRAADAVVTWATEGTGPCMNKFNAPADYETP